MTERTARCILGSVERGLGRGRSSIVAIALATAIATGSSTSRADDASEAQLHFDLGANLYAQRRYAEALEHFLASNRLVPNPGVTHNIAQTYALLERWTDAFNWYETYLTGFELDEAARERGTRAQDALRPRVAVVSAVTEPSGATLFVDRIELGSVGRSPREVAVTAGEHTLIARLEGHREARHTWEGALGEREEAAITLEPILGTLIVRSEPNGAEVFVEGAGEPLGTTPLEVSLPVGPARVTVRHRGYSEGTRAVAITEAAPVTLRLSLSRLASASAVLSVTGPRGATVSVDGDEVGAAPLTLDDLTPGTHRVRVHRGGLEPWGEELVFEAGGVTRIGAVLEDPSTIHFEDLRWLGYGLGGLALAAGVGVGAAAIAERDAFFEAANPTRAQLDLVGALNTAADVLMISGVVVLGATLVIDLAVGGRPRSRADVVVDR